MAELNHYPCLACKGCPLTEAELKAIEAHSYELPIGFDELEEAAWARYQAEEEFGTPNAVYCNSSEPDHNGGWFCYHPECVTSPDDDKPAMDIGKMCLEWEERSTWRWYEGEKS